MRSETIPAGSRSDPATSHPRQASVAPERPPEGKDGGAELRGAQRASASKRSGAEGNRTPGLDSAIVALYQLSYSPNGTESVPAIPGRRSEQSAPSVRRALIANVSSGRFGRSIQPACE